MGLLSLLFRDPLSFVILASLLLYSVIAHEVAHGYMAFLCGDDTAKRYRRLTLNPIQHLDLVGSLMLLFVGFGWAKPVPVNYGLLDNSRVKVICVALAGCFVNFVIACIAIFLLQLPSVQSIPFSYTVLSVLARINIVLAAFNLIPIPPLDGSKIVMSFLPYETQVTLSRLEPYSFFILALLLFTGILDPVIRFMQSTIMFIISHVVSF